MGKYDFSLLNLSPLHHVGTDEDYSPYHINAGTKRFKCFIPRRKTEEENQEQKEQTDEQIKEQAKESIQVVLQNCYYRMEGWWIYEVCPGRKIRQYHQENGKVEREFILGMKVDSNILNVQLDSAEPSNSHISLMMTNGTICDLPTNKSPRETEIRFYCSENVKAKFTDGAAAHEHFVGDISEPSSCGYLVKFYTRSLCKVNKFKGKQERVNEIKCYIDPKEKPKKNIVNVDMTGGINA